MHRLSDSERDALTEVFNIGVSHAGACLSEMNGQEVLLEIPDVIIASRREMIDLLFSQHAGDIVRISESFSGKFHGGAILLIPDQSSLELVQLLLNEDVSLDIQSEMEQDSLSEVGNIILTGCLASIAYIFHEEIQTGLPVYRLVKIQTLLDEHLDNNASILLLKTLCTVQDKKIQFYVTFVMDLNALDQFKTKLIAAPGLTAEY